MALFMTRIQSNITLMMPKQRAKVKNVLSTKLELNLFDVSFTQ